MYKRQPYEDVSLRDVDIFGLPFGAEVNAEDREYATPLHRAVHKGYTEIVELLIENGANVNADDESGETPLDYADAEKLVGIAGILHENDALYGHELETLLKSDVTQFLHKAVRDNRKAFVEALIEAGAKLNAPDEDDATPLHRAAHMGHTETARVLIEAGDHSVARADEDATAVVEAAPSPRA